ncbi:MAG: hypothetical protein PVI86_06660, partial [Phycisphaerae bacterium]
MRGLRHRMPTANSAILLSFLAAAGLLGLCEAAEADTPKTGARPTEDTASTDTPSSLGAIIPIHTEITDITADSVKRRLDEALQRGAKTIIFELDTPGGLVTSTFKI